MFFFIFTDNILEVTTKCFFLGKKSTWWWFLQSFNKKQICLVLIISWMAISMNRTVAQDILIIIYTYIFVIVQRHKLLAYTETRHIVQHFWLVMILSIEKILRLTERKIFYLVYILCISPSKTYYHECCKILHSLFVYLNRK